MLGKTISSSEMKGYYIGNEEITCLRDEAKKLAGAQKGKLTRIFHDFRLLRVRLCYYASSTFMTNAQFTIAHAYSAQRRALSIPICLHG